MALSGLTFREKTYYIHIRDKEIEALTSKIIRQLGADVDKKLSRGVDIVVTDHRSVRKCIKKKSERTKSTVNGGGACSTVASISSSSTETEEATCSVNVLNRLSAEEKILTTLPPVLKEAYQMGITIVPYQDFNKLLDVHQRKTKSIAPEIKPPTKKPLAVGPLPTKIYRLTEPFIKIEDRARQYRPYFEALDRWPTINIRPGRKKGCIFADDSIKSKPTPADADFGNVSPKHKRKASRKLNFDHAHNGNQKLNDSTGLAQTTKSRHYGDRRNARPGYCELCDMKTDNLEEHFNSETHKKHFDSDIFRSLDEEINRGTTLEQFLAEVLKPQTGSDNRGASSLTSPKPPSRQERTCMRSPLPASPKPSPRRQSERAKVAIRFSIPASPKPSPRQQSERQNIGISSLLASPLQSNRRQQENLNVSITLRSPLLTSPSRSRTLRSFRSPLPNPLRSPFSDDIDDETASPYPTRILIRSSPHRGKTPLKTNLSVFK